MIENYGFKKIKCISPKVYIGNPLKNAKEHISFLKNDQTFIYLFPELSLTGYTCEDLFFNNDLYQNLNKAINLILEESKKINSIIVFGLPYHFKNKLYNCSMVVYKGIIYGIVPKSFLPNYNEFYEKRWFTSGVNQKNELIHDYNQDFLFGTNQIFKVFDTSFAIEICEDLWSPISPSAYHAINGAEIILNLSASNELVYKHEYRLNLINQQSAKLNCIYCYAGSGSLESSKDVVFSGACAISENGNLLLEQREFKLTSHFIEIEVDTNKIKNERNKNKTFADSLTNNTYNYINLNFNDYKLNSITRKFNKNPFLPLDTKIYDEILEIQSTGLARQLLASKSKSMVLGISGGSDSTLALFVCLEACKKLHWTPDSIYTISMPGFGTSNRTKNQAKELALHSKTTYKEISIVPTTTQHLKDIDHSKIDVVYENAQARERTQILFDYANKVNGLVVGTSDCSELALGWGTYNADIMSSYNVNSSIMKTMIKELIKHYKTYNKSLSNVIDEVLATKISPELLPLSDKGDIEQDTESILGSYEYHDFFLFHHFKNNFSSEKILFLANQAFNKDLSNEYKLFHKRFYQNQFKRTVSPAGVKVGSVNLSPRGDLRLPNETDLGEE